MRDLEIPDGFELVSVPLHGVAHKPETRVVKRYPDGRVTEFYEAADDQFVKAYNAGNVVWAHVSGFSIHRNLKIVIVNLTNGCQIITDHDPRAVFGVRPGSTEPERFYPDAALEQQVLVPCQVPEGLGVWGTDKLCEHYASLWKAIGRKAELLSGGLGSRVLWDSEAGAWMIYNWDLDSKGKTPPHPSLTGVRWAGIESVLYTEQLEVGYDLTVPGYETFMSADGIILSNTMNVHVPVSREAVTEAIEKLMPSKMPFSIRNPDKIMPALKHEQILGLYEAQNAPSKKTWKFENQEDALAAIRNGTVSLSDEIDVPGMKL